MSRGNTHNSTPNQANRASNFSPEVLSQFLDNQAQQLKLKQIELALQEKEIEAQTKIAERTVEIQGQLLKNKGRDDRKMLGLIITGTLLLVIIILGFLGICLYTNNKDFAFEMIKYLGYPLAGMAGYIAGKKKKAQHEQPAIQDAEILN